MNHRTVSRYTLLAGVIVLLALLLPFAPVPTAHAQSYSFNVPEVQMEVFVQDDASARIVYDITFANNPSARAIDIVDIGLPHDNYDISTMSASIDGEPLPTIRPSEFVDPGVEIPLSGQQIGAGESATLNFEFTMPDMVYGDTTRGDYASLQITPTWWDSEFVTGDTNLQIAIHMLPGIEPDEVLSQDVPFTNKALFDDRVVAVWEVPDWSATGPYRVGVSFPERGMTGVIRLNAFQLAAKWVDDNPGVKIFLGVVFMVLLGIGFFRFSGGTGFSVFVVLMLLLGCFFLNSAAALLLAFVPLPLLLFFNERHLRKRKNSYLPAIAQVEGGGIKRGLTAPEAAIILEQPINKVLTLLIFGMLKKGMLKQTGDDPLKVELAPEFSPPEDKGEDRQRHSHWFKVAREQKIILHSYELPFLDVIERRPNIPVNEYDFGAAMRELIKHAAGRMQGFDLSDTQDYYRSIIKRALTEANEIGDVEQREKTLDRNLEWVLMNEDYGDVFAPRGRRYRYRPIWIRPIGFGYGGGGGGGPSLGGGGGGGLSDAGGATTFGDVAASFAGWTENTMGRMADAIAPGSLRAESASGGIIDLSGADRATGDFFEALAEASSSGGGGGGGGCACAGCACACACAGGGR